VTGPSQGSPTKVSFAKGCDFLRETRQEVDAYLASPGVTSAGRRRLYLKAPIAIGVLALSWALLIFFDPGALLTAICLLGVAFGAMLAAFAVHHDANHGSYFGQKRHNHLLGWTSDALLGFPSHIWRVKHNVAHHTYTNVDGWDDDIDQQPMLRLMPSQPSRPWFRFQHFYVWPIYGFMTMRMHFFADVGALIDGKVGQSAIRVPRGWYLFGYIAGRLVFFTWTLVIPMFFYPWWIVLIAYLAFSLVTSFVVALTFQLAHCVEEATFSTAEEVQADPRSWAVHEVEATVDFCPNNRFMTWFLGGLNFQIEHHLFPSVPHTHYPAIAAIVRRKAEAHGVRYSVHETLGAAIGSHARHLRRMGQQGLRVELEMG
jgi:linoleoyl-CoA desaturase